MDSTISVLMLFTVNTGILTMLCSLTATTMLAVLPHVFAAISINFIAAHRECPSHRQSSRMHRLTFIVGCRSLRELVYGHVRFPWGMAEWHRLFRQYCVVRFNARNGLRSNSFAKKRAITGARAEGTHILV
ncbi:uncharacterized protein LAESUDRAFT_59550 [Laetiporus sulphureus 93-53]|uniref:Uncharacterized protein n=1 Tax=Laetiporus sulphureus 93-53 TaxID=1314785 RepID=A0A165AYP2_9APHY|nr:uncharacterized protein LAESUDRAFT_59550 [Laetiporus sulphureus 93-53]KZS99907.1 hypothetical protein LAESUDRAFT_59550 [Laetiporus sulphureus 93-53]